MGVSSAMAIKFRDVDNSAAPKPAKPRETKAAENLFPPEPAAEDPPAASDASTKKRGRPAKAKFRA